MFTKQIGVAAVAMCLLGASQSYAFDWFGGRLSIGGGFGQAKPKLPYSYHDSHEEGDMWTAHMKYFLTKDFSIVASYADLQPHLRGDKLDVQHFRPIVGSVRYNIFHNLPFTPYLTVGAGGSRNKREIPNSPTIKWNGFTYQGGLGLEFFITEGASLGAEALYHHFEADGDNHPYRLISAVGTVNLYFGKGPSHRRTEEALEQQKAEADRARREAEATKAEAAAAQQTALQAQQGQNAAEAQATAAQQAAVAAQAQMKQAQSDVEELKQMVATKQVNPITFQSGSAQLVETSNETLNKLAEIVKRYPNLKVRVEGHTDSSGATDFNQDLSQRRADSVRDYLVNNGGVNAAQINAVGFGESRPVASNDTTGGRSQNRRVEFIFTL